MSHVRLNDFLTIDKQRASLLFAQYDPSLPVREIAPIHTSMSNSNYIVTAAGEKYLLKLYSNATDKVETGAYAYLTELINIPALLYYDGGKSICPYAYAIFAYIDGTTLHHKVLNDGNIPEDLVYEIGRMCGVIHGKSYPYDALLDRHMNLRVRIPTTRERIAALLNGRPGGHLNPRTVHRLSAFIASRDDLFTQMEKESVLCHGDVNYHNILIKDNNVYFIDFEHAYAGSRYHDSGHFFRRKSHRIQSLIRRETYQAFAHGYSRGGNTRLPENWLPLAHLCDIAPMLCLLDRESVPGEWIGDIEQDILNAIDSQ